MVLADTRSSTAGADGRRPGGSTPSPKRRRRTGPVLLYGPALLLVLLVSVVPVGYALDISLHVTRALFLDRYVGVANFREILGPDGWPDIARTFAYVLGSLMITVPLGVGIAVLLNKPVPGVRIFRVLILLPWVISQTVAALLWKWLLNPDFGPFHSILDGTNVLAGQYTSMLALIAVNVWMSYPLATILSLAALQTVPEEVLEAARVDGCSAPQAFRRIVIPTIKPTLTILLIMLTLLYFNMVTLVYTLTGGGPFEGTQVLSLQAFLHSFQFFELGLGSAYSVVLFAFNVIFGIAYIRVLRGSDG